MYIKENTINKEGGGNQTKHIQSSGRHLPYKGVLWGSLFGSPKDSDIADSCFSGVPGNELYTEPPLPERWFL